MISSITYFVNLHLTCGFIKVNSEGICFDAPKPFKYMENKHIESIRKTIYLLNGIIQPEKLWAKQSIKSE